MGLSVSDGGAITLCGWTNSPNFPTTAGALQSSLSGPTEMFLVFLDTSLPSADGLLYSTFIGGPRSENAYAMAVSADGVVILAGGIVIANGPDPEDALVVRHYLPFPRACFALDRETGVGSPRGLRMPAARRLPRAPRSYPTHGTTAMGRPPMGRSLPATTTSGPAGTGSS